MSTQLTTTILFLAALAHPGLKAADDILIADFEGADYGGWKVTGEAFGKNPAQGALQGQMAVDGFLGKGFVNSYQGGDDTTGTLVSPEFKVERKFLNFLIGGGGFPGETCINLRSLGKVVRTSTGPNQQPGGSERLDWETWDLSDLMGKTVSLEIIDSRKGTWGHLNVDQIDQSDTPRVMEIRQEFTVNQRYLVWPVSLDTKLKKRFFMTLDGEDKPFTFSDICLTNHPDFWVFTDLANFQGRKITITGKLPGALQEAWKKVAISSTYPGETGIYHEPLRPQYHFTSRRGWLNDPNGLVWKDGNWHLFYQHNPYNHGWDNMTWGHAVSPDLFHWKELPPALFPDAEGSMFSGSAVLAPKGKVGFPVKGESTLVLAYTAHGPNSYLPGIATTQSIASSDDNGKTFRKFAGNPVIPHVRAENRDPKVQWHEATKRWILNLYYDGNDYAIYTSPDLVKWEKTCDYQIPGEGECPDMFELPVDGDAKNTRWVVWGANGKYMLGSFDGRKFTAESGPHRYYFGSAYAGQTYSNAPGGRRVHIGWMRAGGAEMQGAPFNCEMTVPMDFSLKKVGGAIRLWAEPSEEVTKLRESTKEWKNLTVTSDGVDPLADFSGGQFEIEAVVDANSQAAEMGFKIFDQSPAIWKKDDQTFSGAEGVQPPVDGKLHIHVFVDTVSMEAFINGTFVSRYLRQTPGTKPVKIVASGGSVIFESLKIHTLRSVWK
ncbi:MAG: glycoside hydrolase family 32 protein [Luteolibacter sp.]|uniref:glycoside hydrolase family 32 protein n=1 Tax=Luteolibacter sp. TaxID=1962973 RepID=UPI003265468B